MSKLQAIAFQGDTIYLVEHNGEPHVPMRELVGTMHLDWTTQNEKLRTRFAGSVRRIPTVAADGKTRKMVCLPLRKLPGWLHTISPARVAPEYRTKVEAYQSECDDALWRYWTQGHATRPTAPQQVTLPGIAAAPPRTPKPAAVPALIGPASDSARQCLGLSLSIELQADGMVPAVRCALLNAARAAALRAVVLLNQAETEARHA